jgi:hypothetical protein
MRETLKVLRIAFVLAGFGAAWLLPACGPVPPNRVASDEVVPKERVPTGYEQKDCHFVPAEEHPLPQVPCPIGNAYGPGTRDYGPKWLIVTQHANQDDRSVECVRSVTYQKCVGADGIEHPVKWCQDHVRETESKPTSSLSDDERCGGPDGFVRSPKDCAG